MNDLMSTEMNGLAEGAGGWMLQDTVEPKGPAQLKKRPSLRTTISVKLNECPSNTMVPVFCPVFVNVIVEALPSGIDTTLTVINMDMLLSLIRLTAVPALCP